MICKIMRIICHGKRYKGIGKVKKYEGLSYDKDIIRLPRQSTLIDEKTAHLSGFGKMNSCFTLVLPLYNICRKSELII